MRFKKLFCMISVLLCFFLFVGCGTETIGDVSKDYANVVTEKSSQNYEQVNEDKSVNEEKIITTYEVRYDTLDYQSAVTVLNKAVKESNGFMKFSNEKMDFNDLMKYRMEASIPTDKVDSFFKTLSESNVLNEVQKMMSSMNETENYVDIELRLQTLKNKLNRLKELSKEKSELNDLIELEKEMTNTIYDIESLESQLQNIDKKVTYTTVTITVNEKMSKVHTETKDGFLNRLSVAFVESFHNVKNAVLDLIIGIVYFLPTFLLGLLVAFGLFKLYKLFVVKNILFFGKLGELRIIDKTKSVKSMIIVMVMIILYFWFLTFLIGLGYP